MKNFYYSDKYKQFQERKQFLLTPEKYSNVYNSQNIHLIDDFWKLVKKYKHIKIIGDYDVDGQVSSFILKNATQHFFPDKTVEVRLPKRHAEGYGISQKLLDWIDQNWQSEDTLIVTVDNGIASIDQIQQLKDKGFAVAVIDHHQMQNGQLPNADLIINVTIPECNPFNAEHMCAGAEAYYITKKLNINKKNIENTYCKTLTDRDKNELGGVNKKIKLEQLYSVYAGLATIADVMPLDENLNWTVAHNAISYIQNGQAPHFIYGLLKSNGINMIDCNEQTFGYLIAPIFNAPSRMYDDTDLVAKGMSTDTVDPEIIDKLNEINQERKDAVEEFTAIAFDQVEDKIKNNDFSIPLFIVLDNCPEGIVGIISGKIVEEYGLPNVCLTKLSDKLKGSGRSTDNYNLFEHLNIHKDLYLGFGGHPGACGITIPLENIDKVIDAYKCSYEEVKNTFKKKIHRNWDIYLPRSTSKDTEKKLAFSVQQNRPYGQNRPEPKIAEEIVAMMYPGNDFPWRMKQLGQDKNHLKIELKKDDGISTIAFNFTEMLEDAQKIDPRAIFEIPKNVTEKINISHIVAINSVGTNTFAGNTTWQYSTNQIVSEDYVNQIERQKTSSLDEQIDNLTKKIREVRNPNIIPASRTAVNVVTQEERE